MYVIAGYGVVACDGVDVRGVVVGVVVDGICEVWLM